MVDSAGIVQYKTAQHSTTLLCRESCHLVHHLQLYKPFNTFHNKTSTIQSNMELKGSNTKTVCVLIHTHTHTRKKLNSSSSSNTQSSTKVISGQNINNQMTNNISFEPLLYWKRGELMKQ